MKIFKLPNPILQHVFSQLSYPDRWQASEVCRQWYSIIHDPYLYQHVELKGLEFKQVLISMQKIISTAPFVRSISLENCWSQFIQDTVVPVPFSRCDSPPLFAPIRHLQPTRRRQEYRTCGFHLHREFSDLFAQLMSLGQVESLTIKQCELDFEMTELFCTIVCAGRFLFRFEYENNGDYGIDSPQLLQTLISATPHMRHFLGRHMGMNDSVLSTLIRRWPDLQSLSLSNGPQPISHQALDELLSRLNLKTLELHDMACLTNSHLALYNNPLSSLVHLRVTKYVTTPLSTPGFCDLLRLFPNLDRLEYITNYNTFHHQFEGVTLDLFEAERLSVDRLMKNKELEYFGYWHEPMTHEQHLMAGLLLGLETY